MFSEFSKDTTKLQHFFECTDIDEKSLRELEDLHIKELNEMPSKWCINVARQIAFLKLKHASSSIVRCGNESYYKYLFVMNDAYGIVESYFDEFKNKILSVGITYPDTEKAADISHKEIADLLHEVIKSENMWLTVDYEIDSLLLKVESLKWAYSSIIHGKFSDELQELVDSVTEIQDIDIKLRKLCLNHFTEYNLEIGKNKFSVYSFYLYNDEESFAIFDVILWIYLHKYSSLSKIKSDWDRLSNCDIQYKCPENVFAIGGDRRFFCECYFDDRISKKIILVNDDTIRFAEGYSKNIFDRLNHYI